MEINVKLSEYAKTNSITYQTAWNHFKKGLIPNTRQLETGTVVIEELSSE
jgi:predicted site-specific integrase-resolvase